MPSFEPADVTDRTALTKSRRDAMDAGEKVTDRMIGEYVSLSQVAQGPPKLRVPISEDGWGMRTRAGYSPRF